MKVFTDYPFVELGDTPGQAAPWRECVIIAYDHDKYCTIKIGEQVLSVKAGYLHEKPETEECVTHQQLLAVFRLSEPLLSNMHGKMVNVVLQSGQSLFGKFSYREWECFVAAYETVKVLPSDIKDMFVQQWVSLMPKSPLEKLKETFDLLDINYLVETSDDENGHWDHLHIVSDEEKAVGKRDTKFFSKHQLFEFQNGQVASY